MVLYFSASGNSRFVARTLAGLLHDEALELNGRIKADVHQPIQSDTPFVLCCPIFAWRIPRLVEDYLQKTPIQGNRKIYLLVTTCGSSGNAGRYARLLFEKLGMQWMGWHTFHMPGSYIAFMENPDLTHAAQMNRQAAETLQRLAPRIRSSAPLPEYPVTWKGRLLSRAANPLFYRFVFSRTGFYSTDACVGCGLCEQVCPVNNIKMENSRPVWAGPCTHCMACIHRCPKRAIEFRTITVGKNRYYNPGKQSGFSLERKSVPAPLDISLISGYNSSDFG